PLAQGRPREAEPAPLELLRHGARGEGLGGDRALSLPTVHDGTAVDERPQELIERRFLPQRDHLGRVADHRLDLHPVPDDAGVLEEPLDLRGPEPRDLLRIEPGAGTPLPPAPAETGCPRRSRPRPLDALP